MSETVKQFIKRKKEEAEAALDSAKKIAASMVAEATQKADKLISYHEGKLDTLKNMEDLDWDHYSKNQLGIKK